VILAVAFKAAGIAYRMEERVAFRVGVDDPAHARDRIILDDISATTTDRVTAIIERERKQAFEELDDEDDRGLDVSP